MKLFLVFAVCGAGLIAQTNESPSAPPSATPVEQILRPPEPGRFKELFQQFRTEKIALAPDGKHLAYTVREADSIYVLVVDLALPGEIKTKVKVIDNRTATYQLALNQREDTPAQVLWLGWPTATRIVVETNARTPQGTGAIVAFDFDGQNARQIADSRKLLPELKLGPGFSSHRSKKMAPLLPTPDTASTGDDPEEDSEGFDFGLPSDTETEAIETPPDPTEIAARSLRVFDYDAERAGALTVISRSSSRGNGTLWLDFHSLDSGSGKLSELATTLVSDQDEILLDRQGRPRLTLPATAQMPFPLDYAYHGPAGRTRPTPLNKIPGAAGFSVSPENFFGERAIPLGFAADPNLLYFASNLGRSNHGIYSLDLRTGQRGGLAIENPHYDLIAAPESAFPGGETLIYDRYAHQLAGVRFQAIKRTAAWLRPELQSAQNELEQALPGHSVKLIGWDESAQRFVVGTESPADPGAFYFYDRAQGKLLEFVRRAPWIEANHTSPTVPFELTLPGGASLDGYVTMPKQPRMKPVPVVLICSDVPWARVAPDYNREVHALAAMGFMVVQLNGRGTWGHGRAQRELITSGYDLVQTQDLVAAIDGLGQRFNLNPKRVALIGRGHGGFIALRALQDFPEKFRCAIALEPPIDLARWLADVRWEEGASVQPLLTRAWLGDDARLKAAPLASAPEKLLKPSLILSYPGPDGGGRRPFYLAARSFVGAVNRRGGAAELHDLPTDYVNGMPGARAEVFDQIEAFLNTHIYDYNVKLHDLKVIK